MSVEVAVRLICDADIDGEMCENPSSYDLSGAGETVAVARQDARDKGWHHRPGGRDICPNCWKDGRR